MSELDLVLRRLAREPSFRAALERDPASALEGLDLSDVDLSVLDAAMRRPAGTVERFFESSASSDSTLGTPTPDQEGSPT